MIKTMENRPIQAGTTKGRSPLSKPYSTESGAIAGGDFHTLAVSHVTFLSVDPIDVAILRFSDLLNAPFISFDDMGLKQLSERSVECLLEAVIRRYG